MVESQTETKQEIFPMNQALNALRAAATPAPVTVLGSVAIPTSLNPSTIGKRHVRIMLVLDTEKGRTLEALGEEIARRFMKKYSDGSLGCAVHELKTMGEHVLEYENVLYLSENGRRFLAEIRHTRPGMLGVSTSPNYKPATLAASI